MTLYVPGSDEVSALFTLFISDVLQVTSVEVVSFPVLSTSVKLRSDASSVVFVYFVMVFISYPMIFTASEATLTPFERFSYENIDMESSALPSLPKKH